jgi:hypothetical protein
MCTNYVAMLEQEILECLPPEQADYLCDCLEKGQIVWDGTCESCPYQIAAFACQVCNVLGK